MGPIGQLVHVQICTGYNKLLIVNILIRRFTLHAHTNYKDVGGKYPG